MSKELTGQGGYIVGSRSYFRCLNEKTFMGNIMQDKGGTSYYESLVSVSGKIYGVLDEIYSDLQKNIGIIQYIPKSDRENLIKVILGLYDICKITSGNSGKSDDCIRILSLSSSDTNPKSKASEREIDEAVKTVLNGRYLNSSDRMDTIKRAMEWGESSAVNGSTEKAEFLSAVMQGKNREFLGDVWLKLLYTNNPREFTGRCGRVICSREYIDHIEKHVFGVNVPNYYGGHGGDRAYAKMITDALNSIAKEIERNLAQGERDDDYIKDENADILKECIKNLERCRIPCYHLERMVENLSWFVGGNETQIRELQHKLNELGIQGSKGRLDEDGVYGKETQNACQTLIDKLWHGSIPSLAWIDPLQPNINHIGIGSSREGTNNVFRDMLTGKHYVRVDPPHIRRNGSAQMGTYRGQRLPINYDHLNLDLPDNPNRIQQKIQYYYNHYPLSDDAYKVLHDLGKTGEIIRQGGRYILVAGAVLDALKLISAIQEDTKDTSSKFAQHTISTAMTIGGSWGGAALGGKLGAMGGSYIGTMIYPGIGTAIGGAVGGLVLGIVGAFGGEAFADWVVDVTYAER